jgi:hypothetical protein
VKKSGDDVRSINIELCLFVWPEIDNTGLKALCAPSIYGNFGSAKQQQLPLLDLSG